MKQDAEYIPVYKQFIHLIEKGLNLIDDEANAAIKAFVVEKQHVSGGFVDRGDSPDLYYSLFGFWLVSALKLNPQLNLLKSFISDEKQKNQQPIEQFSLMLIDAGLFSKKYKTLQLVQEFSWKGFNRNPEYQLFLLLLVADAGGRKMRMLRFCSKIWLKFYNPGEDIPCSMMAAMLVAKAELGMKATQEQKKLLAYFTDESGFRSFKHVERADLLSTAVALFALRRTGFDMQLVAPPCLDFIQSTYKNGAFLSGDGDEAQDLEYTFYGLLALGSLSNSDKY